MVGQGPELRRDVMKFPVNVEKVVHFQLVLGPANITARPGSKRQKLPLSSFYSGVNHDTERFSNLSKVIQLVSGKTKMSPDSWF